MKKYLFILIVLFGFIDLKAQPIDTLIYKSKSKLDWTDFKMTPNLSDSNNNAYLDVTIVTFPIKVDIWFGKITVESWAGVLKNSSWVKAEFKNDNLLNYMQLKYDIANLFAKKAEKEINKTKTGHRSRKIHLAYVDRLKIILMKMDNETDYGRNQNTMIDWKNKFDKGLIE
jgi:hypothetical protein